MAAGGTRDPVGRALDLLTWLAEHGGAGPVGVREVARALGTSPSTAHRLLQAFEERSLVRRDSSGAYFSGLELVRLGRLASRFSVQAAVRPALEKLSTAVGETSMLGLYDPARAEVMVVDCVQTNHPLRYVVELDTWRPLDAGAVGLGVLAFLDDPPTEAGGVDEPAELSRRRTDAQRLGYAISRGGRSEGAVVLAAPIRDADGQVVGDLCLTIPDNRFADGDERRCAVALLASAAEVSQLLSSSGYRLATAGPDVAS